MADAATWLGQPIGLEEVLAGARLVATCVSCSAVTEIEPVVVLRASTARLEDTIRCTCGSRRGRLSLATSEAPAGRGGNRCYLFHL